jgi:magnesium chelatase family protein
MQASQSESEGRGVAEGGPTADWDPVTLVHTGLGELEGGGVMRVECGFTRGFAGLQLIGNMTQVCRDGAERAKAALERLGFRIPAQRLVVSLTPAEARKDGSHVDLALAVSLALLLGGPGEGPRPARLRLAAEARGGGPGAVEPARWLFAAELGLGGELRPVRGVVSFALAALAQGLDGMVVARENLEEVAAVIDLAVLPGGRRLTVLGFRTLEGVLGWLEGAPSDGREGDFSVVSSGARAGARSTLARASGGPGLVSLDFDDMVLSSELETLAAVAAAGMHSLLLRGSPGTGKSMLAARLPSILPPLTAAQHVEAMRVYSAVSERLPPGLLAGRPPFRSPHHQASAAAIMGGPESPGEMALAHGGVLFLDELPEFRRDVLEALREPLETGEVRVSRSRRKVTWSARVMLVAACNNCPCGWLGSRRRPCRCPMGAIIGYRQRLSGPVLDRIDLHVNVPEPSDAAAALFLRLAEGGGEATTARLRRKVEAARAVAAPRNARFGVAFNRDLKAEHLVAASGLDAGAFAELVNRAIPAPTSSRTALRCLRVARTLADVAGMEAVRASDLAQAWAWQAEASARARGDDLSFGGGGGGGASA